MTEGCVVYRQSLQVMSTGQTPSQLLLDQPDQVVKKFKYEIGNFRRGSEGEGWECWGMLENFQ